MCEIVCAYVFLGACVCVSLYVDSSEGGTATRARAYGCFFLVVFELQIATEQVCCAVLRVCVCVSASVSVCVCVFLCEFPLKHCDEVGNGTRARAFGVFSLSLGPK